MSKKEQILQTTLRLITERGLYDTPMSLVCSEGDVAAGTIYHHFKNKEDLIIKLYVDSKSKMTSALLHNVDATATFQRRFVQFWKNLYKFFTDNPLIFKFLEQFDNSPYYNKLSHKEHQQYYKPIIDFLEEGIEEKVLKPVSVQLMTSILQGTISAIVKSSLVDSNSVDNTKLMKAIEISWDGFKLRTVSNE